MEKAKDIVFSTGRMGYIEFTCKLLKACDCPDSVIELKKEKMLKEVPDGLYTFKNGELISYPEDFK